MLNIQSRSEIADIIETTEETLLWTLKRVPFLCDKLTITNLDIPLKSPRVVYDPRGVFRRIQKTLYKKLLLPGLERFPNSHGGVQGKSILTSVAPHTRQRFVYTGDIQNFYPSIHFERVRQLFLALGCSDEAASILTRLCTNHNRLEQGFITSPILADRLFRPADERIFRLCEKNEMTYSRFVDDITISAPFNLKKSGIPKMIAKILAGTGFVMNPKKNNFGNVSKGTLVLGLRLRKSKINVCAGYLDETIRRLNEMILLGDGGKFTGVYYSRNELFGRFQYICWVNNNRKQQIAGIWNAADWKKIEKEAVIRGIAKRRDRVSIQRERPQGP